MFKFSHKYWIVLLLIVAGCRDKDDDVPGNHFMAQEQAYPINAIQVVNVGQVFDSSSYSLTLIFISPGVAYNSLDSLSEAVTGKGDVMFLYLNAEDSTIHNGETYTYGEAWQVNSLEGEYYLNWNIAEEQTDFSAKITEGKLTIGMEGSQYVLQFNGKDEFNKTVTLYYKGRFSYVGSI